MEPAVKNQYSVKNVEICPANFCKRSKYPTIGIGMKISKNFHGMPLPNRTKIGVADVEMHVQVYIQKMWVY